MDNLLLFTPPNKSHIAKLEDLLRHCSKLDLGFHQRNVKYSEKNYNIWAIKFLLKTREFLSRH